MSHDTTAERRPDGASPMTRRGLLGLGGALSFGMLAAACGDRPGTDEPGRVGVAPSPTPLPPAEVDDVVRLRTAASVEYSILEVYDRFQQLGVLDAVGATAIAEFVSRHQDNAERVNDLVADEGGDPWTCPNPWFMDRYVEPILEAIEGGNGIPESDDPQRDALTALVAFENLAGAMYQKLVGELGTPALRQTSIELSTGSARRGSFLAYTQTGAPDGYVDPDLAGVAAGDDDGSDAGDANGLYAITGRFGSIMPITIVIGAADDAGARPSFTLETPADNAYTYDYMQC